MLENKKGPIQAYLDIDTIIKIAKEADVDAIHPGYGFLSESPEFAEACKKNCIIFVGPTAEILSKLGNKTEAIKVAKDVSIKTIPSTLVETENVKDIETAVETIGYPVIIKASWGGGGRGMRVVNSKDELFEQIKIAKS